MKFIDRIEEKYIGDLLLLYKQAYWANEKDAEGIRTMLNNSFVIGIVDEKNDKLIAFTRFMSDCVYKAMIYDIIVHDTYRKKGYGNKLMNKLLQHPLITSVEQVELFCRDNVKGFYEQSGFEVQEDIKFLRKNKK